MHKKLSIIVFTVLLFSIICRAQETYSKLTVGSIAPGFSKKDFSKNIIELKEVLNKQKVVLVFYRGSWCPYCNKYMSMLQDSLYLINEMNATVIAITPSIDENIEKTIKKTSASFHIIHDANYEIMNNYGVTFTVAKKTRRKYRLIGINLKKANGNTDFLLPVPATFVIGQDGEIKYLHFDEDYTQRASVKDILEHLQ